MPLTDVRSIASRIGDNLPGLLADLDRVLAFRSLSEFSRQAWHVIEPDTPLVWSRYHDLICLHLEAVFDGRIQNLIINVPPGSSKSTLACVMWPAWAWLHKPAWRAMFASYSADLSYRDSDRTRDIVASEWYRDTFRPPWILRRSANAKRYFANSMTGWRRATSVGGGATGHRGHVNVVDDPVDPRRAESEVLRDAANEWYFKTYWNRLNNPRLGGRVIIMQRLHELDLTGAAIGRLGEWSAENPSGWVKLMMPAEFEPERAFVSPLGLTDPRTEAGQVLDEERMPIEVLDRERLILLESGYAGQYQQRPAAAAGNIFKWQHIDRQPTRPKIVAAVRYWDKAGSKKKKSAYTAGVLLGVDEYGRFWFLDVVRGRWTWDEREPIIVATAKADRARAAGRFPFRIWIEREPASGGMESADMTIRRLAGYVVAADLATGDKVERARPFAAQVNGGSVSSVEAEWTQALIDELSTFPTGSYKDQVDAAAGAFNKLAEWIAESYAGAGSALGGGKEEYERLSGERMPGYDAGDGGWIPEGGSPFQF